MRGFQGAEDAFCCLVETRHEFRFVDDVAAERNLADADGVFQEIHDGGLLGFPGPGTEDCLEAEHLNNGVLQGAANALQKIDYILSLGKCPPKGGQGLT
jgi:hypothetical protein